MLNGSLGGSLPVVSSLHRDQYRWRLLKSDKGRSVFLVWLLFWQGPRPPRWCWSPPTVFSFRRFDGLVFIQWLMFPLVIVSYLCFLSFGIYAVTSVPIADIICCAKFGIHSNIVICAPYFPFPNRFVPLDNAVVIFIIKEVVDILGLSINQLTCICALAFVLLVVAVV